MLARDKAQPGRQLAPILEGGGIPNSGHERRGRQWTDPLHLGQPLAGVAVVRPQNPKL
jgi:hypothetical protein